MPPHLTIPHQQSRAVVPMLTLHQMATLSHFVLAPFRMGVIVSGGHGNSGICLVMIYFPTGGTPQIALANSLLNSRIILGLPPGSIDQGFNADFTGSGFTDLLLYNRQQGSLDVLTFSGKLRQNPPNNIQKNPDNQSGNNELFPQRI